MNSHLGWTTSATTIAFEGRADAEFFDPRSARVNKALVSGGSVDLATLTGVGVRGVSPQYDTGGEVRVVKTANVRRFELSLEPAQYVTREFADANAKARVPVNSLLITSTGVGSAGRCFANVDNSDLLADGHITVVPVRSETEAAFLCAYLQSPVGYQQIVRAHRGSSRQIEIYPPDIGRVQVPVFDDFLLTKVASLWLEAHSLLRNNRGGLAAANAAISDLVGFDAQLEVMPGDLTWETSARELNDAKRMDAEVRAPNIARLRMALHAVAALPLSDLVVEFRKGIQPDHYAASGSIRVVKSKDVDYPGPHIGQLEATEGVDDDEDLKAGQVLLNSTGLGTLGRATVAPATDDGHRLVAAVDVYVLSVDQATVVPEYLAVYLNSPIGRLITTSLQTGSSGQQHLYESHFPRIPVPLPRRPDGSPDVTRQLEIASSAMDVNEAKGRAQKIADELDRLFLDNVNIPVDLGTVPR